MLPNATGGFNDKTGSVCHVEAFNYQITAILNPTSLSAVDLPARSSCNKFSGLISGTLTTVATSNLAIIATHAGGSREVKLVLTVN